MLDQLIQAHLAYLKDVRKLTEGSIKDAKCTFNRITEYMAEKLPEKKLYEMELNDFLAWLEDRRRQGAPASSLNKQLSQIRGFFEYAFRTGRVQKNVLDGFNIQDTDKKSPPDVLTIEEAKMIVENLRSGNRMERQERVVVLMFYGCGLRSFELCSLDVGDIDMEKREVFVRCGKGGIQRRIPVPEGVWTEMMAYMAERGGKRGPLFKTYYKKARLGNGNVSRIVQTAAKNAGITRKITPKTLRHTFATHLMDAGVNLAVISALMGHRSPSETGIYLHAFKREKKNAVDNLGLHLVEKEAGI